MLHIGWPISPHSLSDIYFSAISPSCSNVSFSDNNPKIRTTRTCSPRRGNCPLSRQDQSRQWSSRYLSLIPVIFGRFVLKRHLLHKRHNAKSASPFWLP